MKKCLTSQAESAASVPEAHHLAATKALDAVFHVDPPSPAKKLRELLYSAFYVADHTTHFYILAGPDFVMGPNAPKAERNILGVIGKVGLDVGSSVIKHRSDALDVVGMIGGRRIHPTCGVPGGVSRPITEEERAKIEEIAKSEIEFAKFTLKLFEDVVLEEQGLCESHKERLLHDPHILHGPRRRPEPSQLLRRQSQSG